MKMVVSVLYILLCIQCLAVRADDCDVDKAYETGDYTCAFKGYMTSAERGDARAQVNVGWMYYYGEGVPQDKAMALAWYRKAAEQGDVTAMLNLAYGLEHGDGVILDLHESRRWYGKAAEQGNTLKRLDFKRLAKAFLSTRAAQTHLAKAWEENPLTAAKEAEESRIAAAAFARAEAARLTAAVREEERKSDFAASKWRDIYARNSGVTVQVPPTKASAPVATPSIRSAKNKSEVSTVSRRAPVEVEFREPRLERIRRAAESGDTDAQVALGWSYSSGKGIPVDKVKAVTWYRLAAEKGNLDAQVALGWLYYEGQGIERNLEESALWYEKAAAQGNMKARQMLRKIEKLLR